MIATLRVGAAAGILAVVLGITQPGSAESPTTSSPVTEDHVAQINQLLNAGGIPHGIAVRDSRGRVELQGAYADESEVDRAFSLAQTVVGVRWVSPVTPQNVKVKQWEDCLSRIFSAEKCGPEASRGTATTGPGAEAEPGPIARKYALVVGVGKFKNQVQPLQYANKDAYDVYTYLLDPQGGNFKRENVIILRDDYATRDRVKAGLDEIRRRATEDDLVLLYFSSHGTPPDKFGGVHLVTYDAEVRPRERIWQSSLTEDLLREFIQGVKAKRLVVVMDACYSNGAYSQVQGFLPPGGKSLDASAHEGYGRSRRDMAIRLLGAKDLVIDTDDSGAGSTPSAPTGWGRILISASDAGERSWESDALRNGVFTAYFIEGLRRSAGAVQPAFEHARALVPARVKQEKGADLIQTPQLTTNRRDWNMSVSAPER